MKKIPLYDLGNEAEVTLLMKKYADNTVGSIEGLPGNMVLLAYENSNPTMTQKELNDRMAGGQRTENGVMAD